MGSGLLAQFGGVAVITGVEALESAFDFAATGDGAHNGARTQAGAAVQVRLSRIVDVEGAAGVLQVVDPGAFPAVGAIHRLFGQNGGFIVLIHGRAHRKGQSGRARGAQRHAAEFQKISPFHFVPLAILVPRLRFFCR